MKLKFCTQFWLLFWNCGPNYLATPWHMSNAKNTVNAIITLMTLITWYACHYAGWCWFNASVAYAENGNDDALQEISSFFSVKEEWVVVNGLTVTLHSPYQQQYNSKCYSCSEAAWQHCRLCLTWPQHTEHHNFGDTCRFTGAIG